MSGTASMDSAPMLADQVALVTGGGSGIGRAVASAYAREGACVVVTDVDRMGGEETVAQLTRSGAQAVFQAADVSRPADCAAMVEFTLARFGRLDIACNNAGVAGPGGALADHTLDGWDRVIGINLSGVFYSMRYELAPMLNAGAGSIVNIASILGAVGFAGAPAYVAAKHGVVGLTRSAALDYAGQGLRINAVGPGFIDTPLIAHHLAQADRHRQLVALHPAGRLGTAGEVAELVLWLSSSRASFVNGAYYPVDGGYLAR